MKRKGFLMKTMTYLQLQLGKVRMLTGFGPESFLIDNWV